mmetsp:Transcript_22079/g.65406  ORF Transcript_22079/g.65406 Transcript_22079/m.65406 type:complete len:200 (-) Transcript_22079:123-722(-)
MPTAAALAGARIDESMRMIGRTGGYEGVLLGFLFESSSSAAPPPPSSVVVVQVVPILVLIARCVRHGSVRGYHRGDEVVLRFLMRRMQLIDQLRQSIQLSTLPLILSIVAPAPRSTHRFVQGLAVPYQLVKVRLGHAYATIEEISTSDGRPPKSPTGGTVVRDVVLTILDVISSPFLDGVGGATLAPFVLEGILGLPQE